MDISELYVIASCAQTKSLEIPPKLHLRTVREADPETRAALWIRQRERLSAPTRPAEGLYSGTYWASVRHVIRLAAALGYRAHLWVASAGYGLVPAGQNLKPYSATFARDSEDRVYPRDFPRGRRIPALQAWWRALAAHARPAGEPRTLTELAQRVGKGSLLVIAGPTYVEAMERDLLGCASALSQSSRLVVVTGDVPGVTPRLAANLIQSDARFMNLVSGSLPTLHVRLAEYLLDQSRGRPLEVSSLRTCADAVLGSQPAWVVPDRERRSDAAVLRSIRGLLRSDPGLSYTAALRRYRSGGHACEQKRFKRLFSSAAEARDAS